MSKVQKSNVGLQAVSGIPVRAVPELRALNSIQAAYDLWDKGSLHEPALKVLEEEHGHHWRKDVPGDKKKNNGKRW